MTGYRVDADHSRVWIEARSSLHPIHGEATGLGGELDVAVSGDRLDLSRPCAMLLQLPVASLQSGNPLYDREMRRRVESKRYPLISGEAREVRGAGEAAEGAAGRYHVRGDLTFHGVTRTVDGEITFIARGDGALVIEGEQVFDIRDFGVDPPRILTLRVHPEVKVRIRVEARPIDGDDLAG
ncbi:MAG: YceI family protein [Carbonactinosporaceae bacterium]